MLVPLKWDKHNSTEVGQAFHLGSCQVTFFQKRLILLSPNVSTGLFSIEVRRCLDPIIMNSVFFMFKERLLVVSHL